uniref:Uncharacterized protein n=1 Tax=Cacopsylla melanoneura TaxID=428564 RepID=A0A8D8ZG88_9HEMI
MFTPKMTSQILQVFCSRKYLLERPFRMQELVSRYDRIFALHTIPREIVWRFSVSTGIRTRNVLQCVFRNLSFPLWQQYVCTKKVGITFFANVPKPLKRPI